MAATREKRSSKQPIAASSRWLVESMRMTMFFANNKTIVEDLFRKSLNNDPEIIQQITAQAMRRDQGSCGNYFYTIDQRPNRLDLVVGAQPNHPAVLNIHEVVQVGEFGPCINHFMAAAQHCIKILAPAERIAFAPALVIPVDTVEDSNRLALEFVPHLKFDPSTSTNLLYQINKRFKSKSCTDMQLMKLIAWQSFTRANLAPNMNVVTPVLEAGATMLRLAMDINTDFVNARSLSIEEMLDLLAEMTEVSSQTMKQGDS